MAKITSKLQVTIPKRIAEKYGLAPGDEVEFVSAGDIIRLLPPGRRLAAQLSPEERKRSFDAATARIRERARQLKLPAEPPEERDWNREDLYIRDQSD